MSTTMATWLQEISDIKDKFDQLVKNHDARYHYEEWPNGEDNHMVRIDATFKIKKTDTTSV
jgi:hypothetical protein